MGYRQALQRAWEEVLKLGGSPKSFEFFNQKVTVFPDEKTIHLEGEKESPDEYIQILLLHYLKNQSKVDEAVSDTWISFKALDGGEIYYPVFRKRSVNRLLRKYENDVRKLKLRAESLNAKKFDRGNWGVIIRAFPKIHVAVALWDGDDEFDAECVMLFNPTIKTLLPTEDVAVLGGLVASKL